MIMKGKTLKGKNRIKELGKEWQLYHFLLNEKTKNEVQADKYIDIVIAKRLKLDNKKLIEDIKELWFESDDVLIEDLEEFYGEFDLNNNMDFVYSISYIEEGFSVFVNVKLGE